MTYIPDPIEIQERIAEDWYFRMTKNVPVGYMECECGIIEREDDFTSLDAYGQPGCTACFARWLEVMAGGDPFVESADD